MIRPLATFNLSLDQCAKLVNGELRGDADLLISGISLSSSEIEAGDIFVAVQGARTHGAQYAQEALKRGAVAVLTDALGAQSITSAPVIVVSDVRAACAAIASSLYKYPTRDLSSIAITGTNGKTTVTTLLYQIFQAVGRECGLIGTVETRIGSDVIDSKRTTPEAPELQALAATMRERHMRHLVMEVSSHALELKRVQGSHFVISGFTNLTQDHLDFHHDMQSYYKAKAKLFTHEYTDLAVINIDSEYGRQLARDSEVQTATLARTNPEAQWHYTHITHTQFGAEICIRGSAGILIETSTALVGAFNLDNLLMAIAIACESGVDPIEIASLTPRLLGAPGRLEPVALGQSYRALVDYAHSPDAVISVLKAAREFTEGRIIAVLGCGGDRDTSKRPMMGGALLEGSDIAVFTSDNPRSEDPVTILNQMTAGLKIPKPHAVIEDRRSAIEYAISLANPRDTVLVLGKGHENGQEINGVVEPFSDRTELARCIEART